MEVINLQPHAVIFSGGQKLEPSGNIARVDEFLEDVQHPLNELGFPVVAQRLGKVFVSQDSGEVPLPDQNEGTFYVVSLYVMLALPNRSDLLVPVGQVRDNAGRIIGCKGLAGGQNVQG